MTSRSFLDRVLTEHPEIEAVQIQFNYADFEDPDVQSHAVYDVCRRHGKPVIVMEPVKGGRLAQLPRGGRRRAGKAARRQRRELCGALCGFVRGRGDGAEAA